MQDEFLLGLPSSEPFRVGIEEDPAADFWIRAVQMRLAQAVLAQKFDQFTDRFLIILQARFAKLFLCGMPGDGAPGLVVECIRVSLNLLDGRLWVERGLGDFA